LTVAPTRTKLSLVRRIVASVVLALVVAAPVAAGIRPGDQRLAERFTLKVRDLESGWRTTLPRSTKLRRTSCPGVPNIQSSITGFSDSAHFRATDSDTFIASTTRVFPSVSLAKRWFDWSGGGLLAKCQQEVSTKSLQTAGYKASDLRRFRESMPLLACDYCPKYVLRAWRLAKTIEKPGDRTDWFEDIVSVRMDYVVVTLAFESYDIPFTGPEIFAESVLQH
jgi:hypothetical protein